MRQLADWSADWSADWGIASSRGGRPPARVVRAAKAAFGQRVPPSELAPLLWDSDADGARGACPGGPGGTGGTQGPPDPGGAQRRPHPGGPRRLWFGTDGLGVELVVEPPVEGLRALSGRLVPAVPATLALVRDTGEPVPVPVDDAGRFAVTGVAAGLLRLRTNRPGRRPLLTAWVLLE